MPTELKIIIALNVIATVVLAVLTLGLGGGLAAGVFPPDHSIEMKLVLIAPARDGNDVAPPPVQRLEIPSEYRTPDLSPSAWKYLPDGTVRFEDSDRS